MYKLGLIVIFTLLCIPIKLDAQTSISKDSLSVSYMISVQQHLDFEHYRIKFEKVLSDSRCPKNVMCIRAGEAKVLVSIFKKGVFLEDKQLNIDASGYVTEAYNLVCNTKDFNIYGFALTPYPIGTDIILEKDYRLELVYQPLKLQ